MISSATLLIFFVFEKVNSYEDQFGQSRKDNLLLSIKTPASEDVGVIPFSLRIPVRENYLLMFLHS